MQAEGIRTGDRHDVYDQFGKIADGWTAISDAEVRNGLHAYVKVRYHDGQETWLHWPVGEQVDLSWGAGGDLQRTVKYPPGTPEYEAYVAELRAELAKFAAGEPPYGK